MSNSPRFLYVAPLSDKIVQLKLNIESLRSDLVKTMDDQSECPTIKTLKINFLQYLIYKAIEQLNDLEEQYTRQFGSS